MNDMANEKTPIYDTLVAESGNPVPSAPVDRSYRAIVEMAQDAGEEAKAEPAPGAIAAVPAPAAPPKPMAAHRVAG